MKLRKRNEEDTNLSFLDVIACGFGAIILLLMITKVTEPIVLEQATQNLEGIVADRDQRPLSHSRRCPDDQGRARYRPAHDSLSV